MEIFKKTNPERDVTELIANFANLGGEQAKIGNTRLSSECGIYTRELSKRRTNFLCG